MEQTFRAILVILLTFSLSAHGVVTPIKKGEPAPYDGFVFDHQSEDEAELYRREANFYKRLSQTLEEQAKLDDNHSQILEKRLKLYMDESNTLINARRQDETTQRLYLVGAFALGVVATGLIVRNVRP